MDVRLRLEQLAGARLTKDGVIVISAKNSISDRIQGQGVLPDLPGPWHAESVIRSAGGTRFAGDFFVVGDVDTGRLDVSVVDVSGKGDRAGARARLPSAAPQVRSN